MEIFSKFNKRRAFNKAVGPEKNPKLITVGPMFIQDYRVRFNFITNVMQCKLEKCNIFWTLI